MGVLAVTQSKAFLKGDGHVFRKTIVALPQVLRDGGIIHGGMLKGFLGQHFAVVHGQSASLELCKYHRIICRVGHDNDAGEVLGRGADHGRSADVDILKRVLQGDVRLGHGLDKGVEVDYHHVDSRQSLLFKFGHVLRLVAAGQQAAVNRGMQRLDPAVENLRKSGDVGDTVDRYAGFGKRLFSAAGREDFPA